MSTSSRPKPTLSTIADAVGVSIATVSNAFNRPDQLSKELRATILEKAAELGVPGPNPLGRNLRRGTIDAVGVVLTEALSYAFSDPAAVTFLEGVSRACEESRSGITLLPVGRRSPEEIQLILDAAVEGFIVYSVPEDDDLVAAVRSRNLPTVWVDQPDIASDGFVGVDVEAAAESCATHLTDLGHRRIGVLSFLSHAGGDPGPSSTTLLETTEYSVLRSRLVGYRRAFEAVGLDWSAVPVEAAHVSEEAGFRGALSLLRDNPELTAVVAMCDVMALGALRACREMGMRVPADISIVGFDGIPQSKVSTPPLSTLHQPLVEKGRAAGEMLLGRDLERIIFPTEFVVRGSTGKAPLHAAHGTS